MKIAFASTDQIHVDEHFGQAEKFYVWTVGPEEAKFSGVIEIKEETGDSADRIEASSAALADCALVYVGQIGGPAAARLAAKKIQPLKSKTTNRFRRSSPNCRMCSKDPHPPGCVEQC